MRQWMSLLFVVLMWPSMAPAQSQKGTFGLMWREGDPFVFCRYGLDQTPRAWFPVSNYTTMPPMPTPGYCPWPTTNCGIYGIGWSQDEIRAYYTYLAICPQARTSGRWKGHGDGTTAPFRH